MESLKFFTIGDLRHWIDTGEPAEGLSEAVITKTRAFSFVHNPYVTDDMPVVSALYVEGELAAFTAAFPERLQKPACYTHWFNSLYVAPKYEGRGYGLFVLGSLMECYENDPVFDLDAVDTSVEILSYLGLTSNSFTNHLFRNKSINKKSIKGKMAFIANGIKTYFDSHESISHLKQKIARASYQLRYSNFVDKEAYDFIVAHSKDNVFLRSQETLNWMLRYPFVNEAPVLSRTPKDNLFSSDKQFQRYYVVKVYEKEWLIGFYILCNSSTQLTLEYLYFEDDFENQVQLSVLENIIKINNDRFSTTNGNLAKMIQDNHLYSIYKPCNTSFCYSLKNDEFKKQSIQGGDGDMFLN